MHPVSSHSCWTSRNRRSPVLGQGRQRLVVASGCQEREIRPCSSSITARRDAAVPIRLPIFPPMRLAPRSGFVPAGRACNRSYGRLSRAASGCPRSQGTGCSAPVVAWRCVSRRAPAAGWACGLSRTGLPGRLVAVGAGHAGAQPGAFRRPDDHPAGSGTARGPGRGFAPPRLSTCPQPRSSTHVQGTGQRIYPNYPQAYPQGVTLGRPKGCR